ncbi:hypothetical protein B0A50_04255 [Salinomyces thailandicus]|uniref:NADP-dependent oxidoreductase domain-containing protein n=1 Tax=Salinomyces thailandicus TaxID=706561 RepID=A0A4V5N5W2_9PEZI|nr:hypothetical protein B0A50_04255 [Salinomyces thailandica]
MAGHVNMMDDVLIANLPVTWLQSSLRTLVSQGSSTQQPFVQHVRNRLLESPPPLLEPDVLFPNATDVSQKCVDYLALTRCIFSSKLAEFSLPYLTHFVQCLVERQTTWANRSQLERVMVQFDGDIVQAVQALKESRSTHSPELLDQLERLVSALEQFRTYSSTNIDLKFPFRRAERQTKDLLLGWYPESKTAQNTSRTMSPPLPTTLPERSNIETFKLGPHSMPRLFNGLWQLSSPAWGSGTNEAQEQALAQLLESGLTTADMADHYGDAELIYGDFRNKLMPEVKSKVFAATKWCVFSPPQEPVTKDWVLEAVKERSRRLGGRVEVLQFHWHDYEATEYLDILVHLVNISKEQPGLVSAIGLCNFDAEHTDAVCSYLIGQTGSVGIVSNQIQFSLFDSRPLHRMCAVCEKYGLKLLTYGSFCGGFLASKWIDQPAPDIYKAVEPLTPSQRKYLDIIKAWGTWEDYQHLLRGLSEIGQKYNVSLSNVAIRWVLQQPAVGAAIVGTRLGVSSHGNDNTRVSSLRLSEEDSSAINRIALGEDLTRSKALFEKLGDCGNEYRALQ